MTISKRERIMLYIVLAAAVGVVLTLAFGGQVLRGGAAPEEIKFPPVPSVDTGLFSDPRFKALVAPRGVPVEAGQTGNLNPFGASEFVSATTTVR